MRFDEEEKRLDDLFMKKYAQVEELIMERLDNFYGEKRYPEPNFRYSAIKCRKEVDLYKQLHSIGEDRNAWPGLTFDFIRNGFAIGYLGYQNAENQELKESFKNDCENFAEMAQKFQKTLGSDMVKPELWKKRQNVTSYHLEKGI